MVAMIEFKGSHFEREVILWGVRWYVAYPISWGLPQVLGSPSDASIFRSVFDLGDRVAWILRLVKIGAEGEGRSVDVMEIHRPDHLGNIADLGLALDEMKRLLAALQQEVVAAQASDHAIRLGHDTASPLSPCRVSRERGWHRLAVTLSIDAGIGSATGASHSPHDLQNSG
jgi:hypothetical protein